MRLNEKKIKKRRRNTYFVISVLLLFALFTPLYSYLYDILEKPFMSAYKNTAELKRESKNIFSSFFSKRKIIEENEQLKHKIAILEVDNLRTQYLETLLERDDSVHNLDVIVISSSIIRKNNNGVLTILGGIDKNFSLDDYVISYDGTLIGRISKVFDKTSQVSLFTKNETISHGILFPQNISISMTGNGNAIFTEINRDVDVNIGDVVYAQDKPGYIIGVVSKIDFDSRDPVKSVYISPIHSLQTLQDVGVIKTTI